LLLELRERFGKRGINEEDRVRAASLRHAAVPVPGGDPSHLESFLARAEARVRYHHGTTLTDPRALELINKTNQFNLNGRRLTDIEWRRYLSNPAVRLLVVDYEDRFGRLGKIAVVAGRLEEGTFV